MRKEKLKVFHIPSIIWGEKSNKVYIAVHGNMSHKEDEVIKILSSKVIPLGYQVLSFDLPEHGDRKGDISYLCSVQNCVSDLETIIEYAKSNYSEINLFACSMGAYFSLLSFKDEEIKNSIFLSPVVNMKIIIENMMKFSNVSYEKLKQEKIIKTNFGQDLNFDYYEFVKNHPIEKWNSNTKILYGENDNLQSENLIKEFSKKYKCELTIMKNGEHFFHTPDQLEFYKKWIDKIIRD